MNKKKIGILVFLMLVIGIMIVTDQQFVRRKKTEKKLLNEMESNEQVLFEGFAEMDYALFLETNTGYDSSLNYFRYGVYENSVKNQQEGEEKYFSLCEKILNRRLKIAGEGTEKGTVHEKWVHNVEEIITDVSTDLKWVVTREYGINCDGSYMERWYSNAKLVQKFDGDISYDFRKFVQHKTENGSYEPLKKETAEQLLKQDYGRSYMEELHENWICFDIQGKLMAVVNKKDEYQKECSEGINIYAIEGKSAELIYQLDCSIAKTQWPVEISQIEGDRNSGWVVFSQGDATYKVSYPTEKTEKIGEFMYGTTYSPDGKYLAYCTGNVELFEMWETMDEEPYCSMYQDLKSR